MESPSVVAMRLFALALLLLVASLAAGSATAQTRVRPVAASPAPTAADSAAADSVAAALALAEQIAAVEAEQARADSVAAAQKVQARADSLTTVAATRASLPTRHAFGSGLLLTLPAGFSAPVADESRLPALARYTAQQTDPARPLFGTVLVVERVVGLNALDRERWRHGQSTYGYPGVRPVGPASTPLPAIVSIATAGTGTRGATAFLQRGQTYWAVAVVAPDAVWQQSAADVLALMTGVGLP
jgi:hypothetical protein